MPVVSFANPKGGSGKSTTCLAVATTLAAHTASVAVLDCDPNRPIVMWATGSESRSSVHVIGDVTENRIVDIIDEEASKRQFVLVDLEGTASRMVSRALSRSDMVIIPMQASAVDAAQAARAVALVREEERVLRRSISHHILFVRTSPKIRTRNEQIIMDELRASGVPILKTQLHQRTAYQSMFTYRVALNELDPEKVNGLDGAIENAYALTCEVLELFKTSRRAA